MPAMISVTGIQRVLQSLLNERVSIRDLPTILEGIAEVAGTGRSPQMMAEHVRSLRLSRQLCAANSGRRAPCPSSPLSHDWERDFAEAMHGEGSERHLAMAPSKLQKFIVAVSGGFRKRRPVRSPAGAHHLGPDPPACPRHHRAFPPAKLW